MGEPTGGAGGAGGGSAGGTPAERLVALERELVAILGAIRAREAAGGDSWDLRQRFRRCEQTAQALRLVVYAVDATAAAAAAARPPPRGIRESGLLEKVVEHTRAARRELAERAAAGAPPPRPSEAITPVPGDPLRLAAREIVRQIRGEPLVSTDAHEAYVLKILRDVCDAAAGRS